ncbi:NUDIX hydrolase [Aridibaculum aurantiacum]|uniref:NUDIX hydrolase n=1 Tax=Aridibaculum aurantiacum TaxID=2810307 RepID=UPI001A9761C5|nr:NUDIX hydrolase [Aridibaculum aurantiacum]
MNTKEEVLELLAQYEQQYKDEHENVAAIKQFVAAFDTGYLYTRHNFTGHITASAFIYDPNANAFLLIEHKTLNRWLQPGGHVETTDADILAAALREAVEETSLPADAFKPLSTIIDIDSHPIPANDRKQEPAHVHHDIRYLFTCNSQMDIVVQEEHVSSCRWIHVDELPEEESIQRVARKVQQLFQK